MKKGTHCFDGPTQDLSACVRDEAQALSAAAPTMRALLRALVLSRDGLDGAIAALLASKVA